jgi:hypothetical protein
MSCHALVKIGSLHRTHDVNRACRIQTHGLGTNQSGSRKSIRTALLHGKLYSSLIVVRLTLFHCS